MDKKQKIISIGIIVLSFLMITISLFCIFTSVSKQFGIFDRILFPVTEQPPTESPTAKPSDTDFKTVSPGTQDITQDIHTTVPPVTTSSSGTEIVGTPWILEKSIDAGKSYQDSLTFLGDSTTHGMVSYSMLTGGSNTKQVWCTKDNTITFRYVNTINIVYPPTGAEMKISNAASLAKPSILVITLGVTGGVSLNMGEEEFKEIYSKLIDSILDKSPSTRIVLQSIFPVAENLRSDYAGKITNEKIIVANEWVEQICEEHYRNGQNVYFLDTFSAIVGEDGYLPENYTNGDGLHMSPEGYKVILRHIRSHPVPNDR